MWCKFCRWKSNEYIIVFPKELTCSSHLINFNNFVLCIFDVLSCETDCKNSFLFCFRLNATCSYYLNDIACFMHYLCMKMFVLCQCRTFLTKSVNEKIFFLTLNLYILFTSINNFFFNLF